MYDFEKLRKEYPTEADIDKEIDYLLDDNAMLLTIINDEYSSKSDVYEARSRLKANKEEISALTKLRKSMAKMEEKV